MGGPTKEVTLYSQWHLPSEAKTLDIEQSKKAKQYSHQKDLYLKIEKEFMAKNIDFLFQEGCEGEIDKNFSSVYYGWDMQKLIAMRSDQSYPDIMVPVPMKMEAKYQDNIDTFCAERMELVKKQNLAFSDLRGNLGFFVRLKQNRIKDPAAYERFKTSYLDLKNKPDYNGNVVEFARTQTMEALHQVEQMIARRNEHMAEIIDSFKFKKASVVIGALHIEDLKEKLEKKDIKVTVVEDPQAKKELAALDILNQFKES
jgi:hypothetical protein